MNGQEEMSRLFEYEVDLLLESNTLSSLVTAGFPVNDLLGQAMTIALFLPAGGTRYFHGYVTQFSIMALRRTDFCIVPCYGPGYGF